MRTHGLAQAGTFTRPAFRVGAERGCFVRHRARGGAGYRCDHGVRPESGHWVHHLMSRGRCNCIGEFAVESMAVQAALARPPASFMVHQLLLLLPLSSCRRFPSPCVLGNDNQHPRQAVHSRKRNGYSFGFLISSEVHNAHKHITNQKQTNLSENFIQQQKMVPVEDCNQK